jgi:AraC-like DNA-binding protein
MGGVFQDPAAGRAFSDLLALGAAAPLYGFFAKAALMATLSGILRRSAPRPHRGEEILAYIRSHPEQGLDAAALAARFSYHKNYVNALVREASGVSLSRYVRRVRMTHACGLMREGGLTPAEVAAELGYYDYSHFYKAFVAELGVSPTAYLKG